MDTKNMPGFTAETSLYKTSGHYQIGRQVVNLPIQMINPIYPTMINLGGGNCIPFCELCESDFGTRTGCSQTCTAKNCNKFTRPCSGCSNPCAGGQFCGGICTDTSHDRNNCGACGNVCPPGVSCSNGTCGCLPGQTICSGTCRDTRSDPQNCGACGNACGVGQICRGGACVAPSCTVLCSTWNLCNQTCGAWPPGLSNYQCWLDCLSPSVNCLNSACG